MESLAQKSDLNELKRSYKGTVNQVQNLLDRRLASHNKDVTVDVRNAYKAGIKDDIASTQQQVQALQQRVHDQNVGVNNLANENRGLNADLKQISGNYLYIAGTVDKSIKALNRNSRLIRQMLSNGLRIDTKGVAEAVIQGLEAEADQSFAELIKSETYQFLKHKANEVQQLNEESRVIADQIDADTAEITESCDEVQFNSGCNLWTLVVTIILVAILPGTIWKVLGGLVTIGCGYLIKRYFKMEGERHHGSSY